jgi:hypothetical protein
MGGQQDGNAPSTKCFESGPHLVPRLGVQAGGGFVQDQKVRLVDERTGKDQSAHHSAGEFGHGRIRAMAEGDELEKLQCLFPGLLFGYIEIPGKNLQILEDGQVRIQTVLLLADADARFDPAPIARNIQSEDLQAAPAHGGESIDHPDRSCLPGTIRAKNPEAFTGGHLKRDPVDRNQVTELFQ